jgi:predicted component of type VI protein secretion system
VTSPNHSREPYQVSLRLYHALRAKAVVLEVEALRDELAVATIDNPDQLRRQRLLIQAQRDEAERLRDFLTRTSVRSVPESSEAESG